MHSPTQKDISNVTNVTNSVRRNIVSALIIYFIK